MGEKRKRGKDKYSFMDRDTSGIDNKVYINRVEESEKGKVLHFSILGEQRRLLATSKIEKYWGISFQVGMKIQVLKTIKNGREFYYITDVLDSRGVRENGV